MQCQTSQCSKKRKKKEKRKWRNITERCGLSSLQVPRCCSHHSYLTKFDGTVWVANGIVLVPWCVWLLVSCLGVTLLHSIAYTPLLLSNACLFAPCAPCAFYVVHHILPRAHIPSSFLCSLRDYAIFPSLCLSLWTCLLILLLSHSPSVDLECGLLHVVASVASTFSDSSAPCCTPSHFDGLSNWLFVVPTCQKPVRAALK